MYIGVQSQVETFHIHEQAMHHPGHMQLFPLHLTYVKERNMEKHVDFLDIPLICVRIQPRSAYKHNNSGECCGVRSELEGGEK